MAEQLVPMTKDGETIHVHPACVEDHLHLGWKLVTDPAPAADVPADPPKKGKAAKAAD